MSTLAESNAELKSITADNSLVDSSSLTRSATGVHDRKIFCIGNCIFLVFTGLQLFFPNQQDSGNPQSYTLKSGVRFTTGCV